MSLKHSWCSNNTSHDWRLFSLLVIYNSPMDANKEKPQPVSNSPMMDDILEEFLNTTLLRPLPAPQT